MGVLNLDSFNRALERAITEIPEESIVTFQKKIAFEVFSRAVEKTPVKTRRAARGWNLTIGEPVDTEVQNDSPVQVALTRLGTLGPFQVIFLTNAVPYIVFLEDGSSQRAPHGMLAVSLAEVEAGI